MRTARRVDCSIERRLLVNFRIDPEVLATQLPGGLRPQCIGDAAVGGICFLRLAQLRTRGLPRAFGLRTENVAHRYAVEWDGTAGPETGVYVERRDTSSRMASLAGGFVFPGRYETARFEVREDPSSFEIGALSRDGKVQVRVRGGAASEMSGTLFDSVGDALAFFKGGSRSYSPNATRSCLDGVELVSTRWSARAARLDEVFSSVLTDETRFPEGSVIYDSALLMHDLPARFVSCGTSPLETPVSV